MAMQASSQNKHRIGTKTLCFRIVTCNSHDFRETLSNLYATSASAELICRLSDDPKTPMPAAETRWLPDVSQDSLKRALSLQPTALSCGIRGFWLLHGLMACLTDTVQGFSAKFLTACAPTYYGMMVAYFIRSKPKESSI